jgi:predicted branched-subunit amino acid permease
MPGRESTPQVPIPTLLPVAAAIAVFGTLYGAAARPLLGSWLTLLSSIVIFSGSVQFTMAGMLATAAGPIAVIWAVVVVNVRNLALGGAIRPRLTGSRSRGMVTSWFLIDETVGLALASSSNAEAVLVRSGVVAYAAWVVGTGIGVAGGAALGLEAVASSMFPVLFIGLAALIISELNALARALVGAAATIALLTIWPGLAGLAPVMAGAVAALPWRRR